MSVGMFCCSQCALGLDVAPCCGNAVHMISELHAAAGQEEAWSVWGSCYTGGKQCYRNESNPFPDYSQIYAIHFSFWYPITEHIEL